MFSHVCFRLESAPLLCLSRQSAPVPSQPESVTRIFGEIAVQESVLKRLRASPIKVVAGRWSMFGHSAESLFRLSPPD